MPQLNWGTRQRHVPQVHCTAVQINKTSYKYIYIVINKYVFHIVINMYSTVSQIPMRFSICKERAHLRRCCALLRSQSADLTPELAPARPPPAASQKAETWWWPAQNGEVFSHHLGGGQSWQNLKVNGVEILGIQYLYILYIYIYCIYIYIHIYDMFLGDFCIKTCDFKLPIMVIWWPFLCGAKGWEIYGTTGVSPSKTTQQLFISVNKLDLRSF